MKPAALPESREECCLGSFTAVLKSESSTLAEELRGKKRGGGNQRNTVWADAAVRCKGLGVSV